MKPKQKVVYTIDLRPKQRELLRALVEHPCVVCGGDKAEAVASFEPENPEPFGLVKGQLIWIPVCMYCLDMGIPVEWLENLLAFEDDVSCLGHTVE